MGVATGGIRLAFTTRPARLSDLATITALYAMHIIETADGSFGDLQSVDDWSFNDSFVANLIKKPSKGFVGIAETEGKIVAMAIAYAQSQPSEMPCLRPKKTLYLESIYVDQRYRRLGIAKRLLQDAENYAREHRFINVELDMYVTNESAGKLYESFGFIQVKKKLRKGVTPG